MTVQRPPYHAFVDGSDIDYPDHPRKLPVIVVATGDDGARPTVSVIAPNGCEYTCAEGMLYLSEPERVSPGSPEYEAARSNPSAVAVTERLAETLVPDADPELERIRNWLRTETIWRVELSEPYGQMPRVNWVEAMSDDTARDVRRYFSRVQPGHVRHIRRATPEDAEEASEQLYPHP